MGVKNLWKILTPFLTNETPTNERIGIDASIWIYQLNYLPSEKIIYILLKRIIKLKYDNNKLLFVFDGTPHELKKETIKIRREILTKKREETDFKDFQNHLKLLSKQNIQNLEEFKTKFLSIENNEHESKILKQHLSKFEQDDLLDWGFAGRTNKSKKLRELIDLKYNSFFENEYDENEIEEFSKKQIQNIANRNKLTKQISDLNGNKRKIMSNYRKSYVLEDIKKPNNFETNLKIFESSSETEEGSSKFDVLHITPTETLETIEKSVKNEVCSTENNIDNENSSSENRAINRPFKDDISSLEELKTTKTEQNSDSVIINYRDSFIESIKPNEPEKQYLNRMNNISGRTMDIQTDKPHYKKTQDSSTEKDKFPDINNDQEKVKNKGTDVIPDSFENPATKISKPQEYKETLNSLASIFKRVLKIFNIPFIDSLEESDSQLAYLQSQNFIDSIISDDNDILLYGGSNIYRNWSKDCKKVRLEDVYTKYTKEDLIKLSILLGSDYSLGKYGYGIHKAVKELNTFQYNEEELKTIKELYERINVYKKIELINQPKIKYLNEQTINWEAVIKFIEANFHGIYKKELVLLLDSLKNINNLK